MKITKPLLFAFAFCIMAALTGRPTKAQDMGGRHPAYLHALSDLRLMRAYLDRMTPDERMDDESMQAIREIDEAIRVIKEASIDDHKDLRDHMPIDAQIQPRERYRKAREAGNAAYHDIDQAEDNSFANGLKHRAMDHVSNANHIVDHIIHRYERQ